MQCLKTECVTNIAFITLIDIVFENGMLEKYYIYSLIDAVFQKVTQAIFGKRKSEFYQQESNL